jgi:hypothetical protein
MSKSAVVMGVLLAACSGSGDEPESCSLAHRKGTYVVHYDERANGSCGAISDQIAEITTGGGVPPGCGYDADDKPSADECDLTRKYTCPLDGVPGTVSIVAITTERDGGDRFDGIATTTIRDSDGVIQCVSTYDVTYTRR